MRVLWRRTLPQLWSAYLPSVLHEKKKKTSERMSRAYQMWNFRCGNTRARVLCGPMLRNVTRPMSLADLRNYVRFSPRLYEENIWSSYDIGVITDSRSTDFGYHDDSRSKIPCISRVTINLVMRFPRVFEEYEEYSWKRTLLRILSRVILIMKCRSLQNLCVALIVS